MPHRPWRILNVRQGHGYFGAGGVFVRWYSEVSCFPERFRKRPDFLHFSRSVWRDEITNHFALRGVEGIESYDRNGCHLNCGMIPVPYSFDL